MKVDNWPRCAECGSDFHFFSNEYTFPDGVVICSDCFDKHREEWDKDGTKYFFQHVPGAAWPNAAYAFTFKTEGELLERLTERFGDEYKYSHRKGAEWSHFNGSYIMITTKNGGNWCLGNVNCDLKEIPVLNKEDKS